MAEATETDYPIGIHFGHTELSSAYYNSANEIQFITTIPSSPEWQEFFIATMRDNRNHIRYDDPGRMALCTSTLSSIINATFGSLSRTNPDAKNTMKVRGFSVPQQFHGASSQATMLVAAENAGYIKRGHQVIAHFNSARLGYNLDNCAAIGLPLDCNVDEEDRFALVVNLGETYLSLGFANIGKFLFSNVRARHWVEEPQESEDESRTTKSLPPFALQRIQDFLAEQLSSFSGDVADLPSHVVAIILTGEASASAMSEMRSLLAEALPTFSTKFKFSIEPRLVGVQGAAHRARQTATDPWFTGPEQKVSEPGLAEQVQAHDEI